MTSSTRGLAGGVDLGANGGGIGVEKFDYLDVFGYMVVEHGASNGTTSLLIVVMATSMRPRH